MPNRVFRDGFVDSNAVAGLSDWSHRVYTNLIIKCDDAGRIDARLEPLRSALFPNGTDRKNTELENALDELVGAALVLRYEFKKKPFVQVTKWQRYGNATTARCPGPDGSFKIEYTSLDTRDGLRQFVVSSLPDFKPTKRRSDRTDMAPGAIDMSRDAIDMAPGGTESNKLDVVFSSAGATDMAPRGHSTLVHTNTNTNTMGPSDSDRTSSILRETGIGLNVNPKTFCRISQLVAIAGADAVKDAIQRAMAKGIGCPACVSYAEKIIVSEQAKRDLTAKKREFSREDN